MNTKAQPKGIALLRRCLDAIYLSSGFVAAFFLILILLLIVLQMVARWVGMIVPGATEYAGYCMAAASFFAFAYALNNGSHIRVNLLLGIMGRYRRLGEIWCFAIAAALAIYWARYAIKTVLWSRILNDVSQGQDATPLWIPQMSMAIGSVIFAVALVDNLVSVVFAGTHSAHAEEVEDRSE